MIYLGLVESINWQKQIGKIWADNCFWTVNDPWFNCTYLKIRLIPDFGYLKIYYNFKGSEGIHSYAHTLEIEKVEEKPLKGSFKVVTDHESIMIVEVFGIEPYDSSSNMTANFMNELLITTRNYQLLIIPDWATSTVKFTFDKGEIETYLISGWENGLKVKRGLVANPILLIAFSYDNFGS